MITHDAAEQAHQTLVKLLEIPRPIEPIALHYISAALDVLCWVLEHPHNPNFADNLSRLERAVEARRQEDLSAAPTAAGGTVQ
ncbi:MAG: hypothetical protein ACRD9L_15195 [Bryobacteraceae bacterium]